PQTRPAAPVGVPLHPAPTHAVFPGDPVFTLARRPGVPPRAIIDATRLQAPYALNPGDRLTIPAVRVHEVRSGDTASQVAQRYGVSLADLVRANGIEAPYIIRIGQRLVIPGSAQQTQTAIAAAPIPTPVQRPVEQAALPPPPVAVQPMPAPPANSPPSAAVPPVAVVVPPPAQPAPQAAPQPAPPVPSALTAPEPVDPARAGRFLWPVLGIVLSDYGPKPCGLQNDGVNIADPRGPQFRRSAAGTVIYAGNALRGFGNLLLLRHDGGYVTAYAHADELLGQRGDNVRRGQTIGRVGSSGGVATPQLHFEVRRGTRAVNPTEYLGSQSASN
ncbi:MAG: peptidoglycan DD-metalloendopeptidase family protein, partial [Alphaproteobacteria bacterium]|nr:peptidoglycan DD-metalloendopeptidase family protein [Alphaproteobacteria bacterium]